MHVFAIVALQIGLFALAHGGDPGLAGDHPTAELLNELLSNNLLKRIPGNVWSEGPVKSQIGLTIRRVHEFDMDRGQVSIMIWLRVRWTDPRLFFNGTKYFGRNWIPDTDSIAVRDDQIWHPTIYAVHQSSPFEYTPTDIYLFDEVKFRKFGYNLQWSRPVQFANRCEVNFDNYPFDQQLCHLRFEPWSYNSRMVKLSSIPISGNGWDMSTNEYKVRLGTTWVEDDFAWGLHNRSYSGVEVPLFITRYPNYFVTNAILPMIIVEVISWLTFWIPIGQGERISCQFTAFLTIVAIMLFTASKRPAVGKTTFLDQFQAECVLMSFLPVVLSILVSWLKNFWDRRSWKTKHTPSQVKEQLLERMLTRQGVTWFMRAGWFISYVLATPDLLDTICVYTSPIIVSLWVLRQTKDINENWNAKDIMDKDDKFWSPDIKQMQTSTLMFLLVFVLVFLAYLFQALMKFRKSYRVARRVSESKVEYN